MPGFHPGKRGSTPLPSTNLRINYPETGRFETSDWLWCNGAQHPLTRFESVACLGGRGSGIEVRILINQQMEVWGEPLTQSTSDGTYDL